MRRVIAFSLLAVLLIAWGCAKVPSQVRYSWKFYSAPEITPETFSGQSVAILPPSSIEYDPAQEIYRETLAGILYTSLLKYSGGPRFLSLDDVQSSINKNELWNDFKRMYSEFEETSVMRKDILSKVGQAENSLRSRL